MFRQSSSRIQRAKGLKLKHALQILVLVGVCVWLVYQVKHSHDKKKAFEAKASNIVNKVDETQPDIFRINRKDLPQIVEINNNINNNDNEVKNDEENEEADEAEQEANVEDEEGSGDGDGEIDEQDQEQEDEEAERGEFADEEEKENRNEELKLVEHDEHDVKSHEAQEERFKSDDVSNAVDGAFVSYNDTNSSGADDIEISLSGESTSNSTDLEKKELETESHDQKEKGRSLETTDEVGDQNESQKNISNLSEKLSEPQNSTESTSAINDTSLEAKVDSEHIADASNTANVEQRNTHAEAGKEATDINSDSIRDENAVSEQTEAKVEVEKEMSHVEEEKDVTDLNSDSNRDENAVLEQTNAKMEVENETSHVEEEKESSQANSNSTQDHDATQGKETHADETSNTENVASERTEDQTEEQKEANAENSDSVQDQNVTLQEEAPTTDSSKSENEPIEQTEVQTREKKEFSQVNLEDDASHAKSDPVQDENSMSAEETHRADASNNEIVDAGDSSHALLEEEKEAHADLSTLPETRKEGSSAEEVAAE